METKEMLQMKERNGTGRLINFRPVFTFALFLILGILSSYIRILAEKNSVWMLLLVLGFSVVSFCIAKRKLRCAVYISIFCAAFFVGSVSFALTVDDYRSQPKYSGAYTVSGTVTDKTVTDYGCDVWLTNLTVDGVRQKGKMSVRMAYADCMALEYCDRVSMRLTVSTSNLLEGSYGFRAEAIADSRLYYGSNVEEYSVVGVEFRLGTYLRGRMQDTLRACLSEEAATLAIGVLLGDTSAMEEGLIENIRYGGIAHIFAVSGLHIGAMFAACVFLFRRKLVPAPIRFCICLAVLLFYGSICGYSASVVRATVTCAVLYLCSLSGLKTDPLENLSIAAVIVLLLYPTLLFGVGAQLSFGACLGILLLARPLERGMRKIVFGVSDFVRHQIFQVPMPLPVDIFRRNTSPAPIARQWTEKILAFLSFSLAAQIGTAPVLYMAFGYFSVTSIAINCVFVPIVSVCFAPLLAVTALALILPQAVGAILLYPVGVVSSALLLPFHVLRFSAGIVQSISLTAPAMIAYYSAVAVASDKINLPKWQRRVTVIAFVLAFVLCVAVAS